MFASEFQDLCQESIVWEQMTSRDSFGKPIYAAPVVFSPFTSPVTGGRRVFKTIRKGGAGGVIDFVSGSYIWILATPPIKLDDRVYVQGDAAPFPPVLFVESFPDETGLEIFVKVTMGSALG